VIPNSTGTVNPSDESLAALAREQDVEPIAMLNLLRYADGEGRAIYNSYAAVAATTIANVGGALIYLGSAVGDDSYWDTGALVYYPRRASFLEMQADPAYQAAIPDRTAGLNARLLYPFSLPEMSASEAEALLPSDDGMHVTIELVRRLSTSAEPVDSPDELLRLTAGGPGLVSDGRWDELRLCRPNSEPPATREADVDRLSLETERVEFS